MTHKNVLGRLLHQAGFPTPVIVCIMTALKFDDPQAGNPDYLGKRLWAFIAKKQKEAVLNALACDALERQRMEERLRVAHCDPLNDDPDQLTLDLAAALPWPSVDKTGLPDVHQ